jgi:ribose transport system substrate-binding protein
MRLAVFTKNFTNPAYAAARLGAERAAQRLGARVNHYVPQKADNVAEQSALIDVALAAKPDAFVFVPVHYSEMIAPMQRVRAAGIPVVGYLNRLDTGRTLTFVGVDDYQLGCEVTRYLARHLTARGNIVLMQGPAGSLTSVDRMRGFHDALKQYPGIEVLSTLLGEYQQREGRAAMDAFLSSRHARIDAVLASNDSMALGAIESLAAHRLNAAVIGVNAIAEAIDAIKRGTLLATADFDTLKIACVAVEAAVRHLRGEKIPADIILPVEIVDRSNYAAWDRPLDERECPRWEHVT